MQEAAGSGEVFWWRRWWYTRPVRAGRRGIWIGMLGGCLAALLVAPGAEAFERQWHVGGGLGFSNFDAVAGPTLGLHGAYGLSDMFDLRLELTATQLELVANSDALTRVYAGVAGISYKLDIIEWIPYFGLGLGYYYFDGVIPAERAQGEPGVSFHAGIDYAFNRSFGMGAQISYHGFLIDAPTSLADTPYAMLLLRAEYRWGW